MENKPVLPAFTHSMTKGERIAGFFYIPLHIFLVPYLCLRLLDMFGLTDVWANLLYYLIGVLYMLLFLGRYLRREFDPLCDRPLLVLSELIYCFGLKLIIDIVISIVFRDFSAVNPNNAQVAAMVDKDYYKIAAVSVFLSPIVEECMFRGCLFGTLRRRSRALAYIVSAALFSLYHVWGYAIQDPVYWVFVVQYFPVSLLLCRCYERTNSIWTSIFYHMLINGIAVKAMSVI